MVMDFDQVDQSLDSEVGERHDGILADRGFRSRSHTPSSVSISVAMSKSQSLLSPSSLRLGYCRDVRDLGTYPMSAVSSDAGYSGKVCNLKSSFKVIR